MKITAITRYKHGGILNLMRKLGWSNSELARRTGISQQRIGNFVNLTHSPNERCANLIQKAFAEVGEYFDPLENWDRAFNGFKRPMILEQTKEVDVVSLLDCKEAFEIPCIESTDEPFSDSYDNLNQILSNLGKQEREVIKLRYYDNLTLAECASKVNLTGERVRQVEHKALRRLRHPSNLSKLQK